MLTFLHECAESPERLEFLLNRTATMADLTAKRVRKKDTSFSDRQTIFFTCRASLMDGHLKKGIQSELARLLGFDRKTINRQWRQMSRAVDLLLSNEPEDQHDAIIQANTHILFRTGHSDRRLGKYKYDREEMLANIAAIPIKQRRTVRKLAAKIGIPPTTIQGFLKPKGGKRSLLVRHVSKLKPTLTEMNKVARFEFALEQVNIATMGNRSPSSLASSTRSTWMRSGSTSVKMGRVTSWLLERKPRSGM
jgi:hypothetical protein